MFRFQIDEETELRLLEERHAEELFALTDKNRNYLRRLVICGILADEWCDESGQFT